VAKRRATTMQWKTFWSLVAPLVTAVWVAVWLVTGAPVWLAGLATALVAAAVAFGVRGLVRISPMFRRLSDEARGRITGWLVAAVAAYACWTLLTLAVPAMWLVWTLLLLALSGGTWVLSRVHEYLLRYAPPPARPAQSALAAAAHAHLVQEREDLAGPRDGEPYLAWQLRLAMRRAGLEWLRVSNPRLVGPTGQEFGVRVEAWAPIEMRRIVNGKVRMQEAPRLGEADARRIALALRDIARRDVATDWVQISEDRDRVGVYTIQANTMDVMSRVRPYRETPDEVHSRDGRPVWRRLSDPVEALWGMDGMPIGVDVARHAWILGATTGGKSAFIHREWADVSKCEDALIWVCGVRKLYDLVGMWLEPYLGTDFAPPLDWVRADAEGVVEMLIAAMEIARWRQDQPFAARRNFQKIMIYIDEASFALNTKVKVRYDGAEVTAGDMYAECTQAVASANIHLVAATQRGVHHAFGDKGGDAAANIGREIVLPSGDDQEAGRVTGDYKLAPLRHRGECYARLGDQPHVRAKIEYVQTADPSKPVLHDGPRVDEIAWNRRYHRKALDAGSAAVAGDAYNSRHTLVTDAYLADLRGARAGKARPVASAATVAHDSDQAMATAVASIFGQLPSLAAPAPVEPEAEPAPVAELAGYRTRADRVEAVVRSIWESTGAPAGPRDILAALHEGGDDAANPQLVANALRQLGTQGRLIRPSNPDGREVTGLYLPPDAAATASTTVTVSNS
jgi:hypothetical protein